jgi:hypothetical protein
VADSRRKPFHLGLRGLGNLLEAEPRLAKKLDDCAWIDAIDINGWEDWYEPLRRRMRTNN